MSEHPVCAPIARSCWQCNAGGYVVPANRIKPKGGAPSLIKCGICQGTGRLSAATHDSLVEAARACSKVGP